VILHALLPYLMYVLLQSWFPICPSRVRPEQ
jgi:hypothetical protein